jgi:hypothetical protein
MFRTDERPIEQIAIEARSSEYVDEKWENPLDFSLLLMFLSSLSEDFTNGESHTHVRIA